MLKPTLWLMVGPPGSGKSTAAKKMFNDKTIYVSRDEIRFSFLHDGDDYFAYEDQVLETFYTTISTWLNDGYNVIADATHLTEKARKATLNGLITNDNIELHVSAVVACTPLEVALDRNAKREGRAFVPPTAIKRMYASTTDPREDQWIKYDVILYINENQEIIEVRD